MALRELTAQLKRDEGFSRSVYQDSLGYFTIGYGRLVDARRGGGISEEEAEIMLTHDIVARISGLSRALPWFPDLDDARQGVLINMSFQLGVEGLLGFSKTLAHIKAGNYKAAADEMLQSRWALQTPARAARLSDQMQSGEWV